MYFRKRSFPAQADSRLSGYVLQVASDMQTIVAAGKSSSNYINVIDCATFKQVTSLGGKAAHSETVCAVKHLDKNLYASCGRDGFVRIWDSRSSSNPAWEEKIALANKDAEVNALAYNGEILAVSTGANVKLCDMKSRRFVHEYSELHAEPVTCLEFKSRELLVTGSEDGMVSVADVYDLVNEDDGQAPVAAMNTENGVRSIRVLGNTIFAVSATETISTWNLDGSKLGSIDGIPSHPLTSADGSLGYVVDIFKTSGGGFEALAGRSDGSLVTLDISTSDLSVRSTFSTNGGHNGVVRAACKGPNGSLYTAGEDGQLLEWTTDSHSNHIYTYAGPSESHRRIRDSPY